MSEEKKDLTEEVSGKPTVESKPTKKKKLKVVGHDNYGMHYVGFEDGGRLPESIKGARWTSLAQAEAFCETFNEGR